MANQRLFTYEDGTSIRFALHDAVVRKQGLEDALRVSKPPPGPFQHGLTPSGPWCGRMQRKRGSRLLHLLTLLEGRRTGLGASRSFTRETGNRKIMGMGIYWASTDTSLVLLPSPYWKRLFGLGHDEGGERYTRASLYAGTME